MKLYERFADKEFHTSIATSFGIDFDAYESIVLPRLRGAGCRNNIVITDGRMLTHALGGASALPRHAGKLYTVSGATATGVFHPKIFLQAGRRRGRLIVSSANLTAPGLAGNLELASVIACDETPSGEQQLIAQAWHYLLRFCNDDEQGVSAQLEWMRARARWLDRATPTTGPVGLADGSLAALLTTGGATGIGQSFIDLIGEPVTRLIVLSPYWDMNLEALEFLAGGLSAGEISIVIDAGCATFSKHGLGRTPGARLYDRGDFRKGRFIHAKMLIAQTQDADHVLLGSANCTAPALGSSTFAGVNEEVCLYRRYPAGTVLDALGLTALLAAERRLDPAALPHPVLNEELPLAELTTQNPGRFECRVDTLTWHPSGAYDPAGSSIELLDQQGKPIVCRLLPLQGTGAPRYQISDTEERPAFARVMRRDGKVSAPAIVTLIDRLRAVVRETASRQADSALRQLDSETEASLLLFDVLNVIERFEQGDGTSKEPLSIPKAGKNKEESALEYKKLSYEEFIARRRPRTATQLAHNSLAGSDLAMVRSFLNRIVGLEPGDDDDEEEDQKPPRNVFDMGDETADAQAALNAGEGFDTEKTSREEEERAKAERRRAAARKATKEQIAAAAQAFRKRIRDRKEGGALDNQDILRLRALLMIICTAACPAGTGKDGAPAHSRLQVLPSEGDHDSWPFVLGRALFEIFGGRQPVIRHFYVSSEHDQIPDDIIECWATCYWCLQTCLAAPLSSGEQKRIRQHLKPLVEIAYRLTLPSKDELLGEHVIRVMDAMSESYAERLGVDPAAIVSAHRAQVEALFRENAKGNLSRLAG